MPDKFVTTNTGKFVVEIFDPEVTKPGEMLGHGELLHIVSRALEQHNKPYSKIRVSYSTETIAEQEGE